MSQKDADGITKSVDPDQTGYTLCAQTCLSENLGPLLYHWYYIVFIFSKLVGVLYLYSKLN